MTGLIGFIGLWSHAVAALVFAVMALWQMRVAPPGRRKLALVVALALCALWAISVAGTLAVSVASHAAESLRNLGILGLMYASLHEGARKPRGALSLVYGAVAAVTVVIVWTVALAPPERFDPSLALSAIALRMMAAAGGLVLLHNLYSAAEPGSGSGFKAGIIALAALWLFDLNLYTIAYLSRGWPEDVAALRGLVAVGAAVLLALALHRGKGATLTLSRTMTFQTLSLAAVAVYLIFMAVMTSVIAALGGDGARIAQAAFVFGTSAAVLALPSARARAWIKVKLAKHLFQHRYDYRAEWLRFNDTLGEPAAGTAPLSERVIKAIADITDSPEGLLFAPDGNGLALAARWNWAPNDAPAGRIGEALATSLAGSGRIIELDAARRDDGEAEDLRALPQWLIDDPRAWVLVPLIHFGKLAGAAVLGRPALDRALDWEDFDLLRVASRQASSYLVESRSQQALEDAQRFEDFNRRFAFIMHDVKNLVSQLSLVARNAEKHAENPAFRADMVATLKDSADKMNALLARLSQHNNGRAEAPRPVPVRQVIEGVATAKRLLHPIVIGRSASLTALADPVRLEKLVAHLVQNAIDASPPQAAVRLDVRESEGEVAIDIVDHGCGMSPAFIRERLFTAFASTKAAGFGVGAYEARQLAHAMGGRIEVASREGEGSRFTVYLPQAQPARVPEVA